MFDSARSGHGRDWPDDDSDRRWRSWHHRVVVTAPELLQTAVAELDAERRATINASDLEARLVAMLVELGRRWPTAVADDAFATHLGRHLAAQPDLAAALPRLRLDDLFLAWWAGTGNAAAVAAFETAFTGDIDRLVARFHRLSGPDLRQRLRIKLLVPEPSAMPRIHDYSGFGHLQNWLRVTATRLFVDVARSEKRALAEQDLDEGELLGLVDPADPGVAHLRAELRDAVKAGFATAVASLQPRHRTFLRHVYVDRLTLDQIAATYDVHRATVARALAAARDQLIGETRRAVAGQLGVSDDELCSAIGALDSRLELSLSRVLRSAPGPT